MEYNLESEADVINLIGYDTPMEFVFTNDYMPMFKTCFPVMTDWMTSKGIPSQVYYQVEFYANEGEPMSFFRIDAFSKFLEKYQIARVVAIDDITENKLEIYFKKYQQV